MPLSFQLPIRCTSLPHCRHHHQEWRDSVFICPWSQSTTTAQLYRSGFSDRQSRFCRTAADLRLDSIAERFCRWMAGMYIVNLASCMCYTGRFSYRTQEVISETSCQYGSRYTLTNGGGAIEQPFPVYVSYPVFCSGLLNLAT